MEAGDGSNSWLSKMEMLLDPDGCSHCNAGVLPEHLKAGLTRLEQAEDYAKYISSISREYVPLSRAKLPELVSHALDHALCRGHPLCIGKQCTVTNGLWFGNERSKLY